MSRCFPFPPPGYEKEFIKEDLDLLKKEKKKLREKKQKKEKRDKEKKEGKAKREKDRSDEKEKEKKAKKEKHRDKKKDRDNNRDKDKNNHVTSDVQKLLGHAEAHKGENNHARSKGREKEKCTVLGESGDKVLGYSTVYNGAVVGKSNNLASANKNLNQIHDLGSKIASEEGKRSNLLSEKFPPMEKKDVGMPRIGVSTPATPMATSERSKERKINDGKMDRHGPGTVGRPIENMLAQKFAGMAQNRVEGVTRQVGKISEQSVQVKEKIMGIEGDGKKGVKRKDGDREKKIEKYKERDKKTKGEERNKKTNVEERENKMKVEEIQKHMGGGMVVERSRVKDNNKVHADLLRGKDGSQKDLVQARSASPAKVIKEDNTAASVATPEIFKKQNEFSPNGVLHEDDVGPKKRAGITSPPLPWTENGRRPSQNSTTFFSPVKQQALSNAMQDEGDDVRPKKVAKITSSSLLPRENGRSLQSSQNSTVFAPVKQQALSSVKQDYKDRRKNGTINSLQSTPRDSQNCAQVDQNSATVKKLPHPDTKYLEQILSLPVMEEWSEFDEQDWLFTNSHSQQNKPKAETSKVDDNTHHVWAEPLRIEYVDVLALPYVIPR